MTALATMPGRFGDILWALPTVRAIADHHDEPVELAIAPKYRSILELLRAQPYILDAWIVPAWDVQETAPMTPWEAPLDDQERERFEWIYHLGYRQWPTMRLAHEIGSIYRLGDRALRLDEPWITAPHGSSDTELGVAVGFSDEYVELKMGILLGLRSEFLGPEFVLCGPRKSRLWEWWVALSELKIVTAEESWSAAANVIARSKVFLGCLSAPWVLANALGKPTVIVEPNPQRHHPIFWRESPKNHLVTGNDGKPTFDLRHVKDTLASVLRRVEAETQ